MTSWLITGGTGSLGQALIRDLLGGPNPPDRVLVYSRDEQKQDAMAKAIGDDGMSAGSRVRFNLGDVRDLARLTLAMRGVDVVVHAAALKIVPALEYNPFEAIQTNVLGAQNVITAALANGVDRVLALSTDKACLASSAPVELADGRTVSIRDYVAARGTAPLRTWTGEAFTGLRPTGWHRNSHAGRRMFHIALRDPQRVGKGARKGLWLSDDHLLLTPSGWRRADSLHEGDLVLTSELAPNPKQRSLLLGMILGDASLARHRPSHGHPNTYLISGHAENQLEWLLAEYHALREFAVAPPRLDRPGTRGGQKRQPFWVLRLASLRCMLEMYEAFYTGGTKKTKRVPRQLFEDTYGPEALAAWYMDDGTYAPGQGKARSAARLETQSFPQDDVEWLAVQLTLRGMPAYAYRHRVAGRDYWQLRLTVEGAAALFALVGRFVPPALRYKLPPSAPAYDPNAWDLGPAVAHISPITVLETKPPTHDLYCLDVPQTHNFCAGGFIVHNCQPVNLYGATKLCAEKLFAAAGAYVDARRPTRFACLRYGNVAGSRGSVIPFWRDRLARHQRLPITDPDATRFWITLPEAVSHIRDALEAVEGGELVVPKLPGYRIGDLAAAVAGADSLPPGLGEFIGLRPGEKRHEWLVGADEERFMDDAGPCYVLRHGAPGHHRFPDVRTHYTSDSPATRQMSVTELREQLAGVP